MKRIFLSIIACLVSQGALSMTSIDSNPLSAFSAFLNTPKHPLPTSARCGKWSFAMCNGYCGYHCNTNVPTDEPTTPNATCINVCLNWVARSCAPTSSSCTRFIVPELCGSIGCAPQNPNS